MKIKRKMIRIDEDKCDGCGLCVPACAEGALQIIDGKARLVSEVYCDGLGACLGECPRGAITIEEREAEEYDPKAVEQHLAASGRSREGQGMGRHAKKSAHGAKGSDGDGGGSSLPCGCPGSAVRSIHRDSARDGAEAGGCADGPSMESALTNWPVQIKLLPPKAPYLDGARLLIAADCVPFAYADFHRRFVKGHVALVGCPKLDDAQYYIDKLASIFEQNDIIGITLPYMEVPCCHGLVYIVEQALAKAGRDIPVDAVMIGVDGSIKK